MIFLLLSYITRWSSGGFIFYSQRGMKNSCFFDILCWKVSNLKLHSMRKSKAWLWIVVAVVVVALALIAWWVIPMFGSSYYAVYLNTGDLYFGKLSTFPSMKLSDVWYLQRDQQNQLALSEFSKVLWGPRGDLKLSSDSIVWMAKISSESQILPVLKGEKIAQQPAAQRGVPQTQSGQQEGKDQKETSSSSQSE